MDTTAFLERIKNVPGYKGQVIHVERFPPREARYGRLDHTLPPELQSALREIGAGKFYTHQAQAINAVRKGLHVVLSTGTASGKTLAYNVPVLEAVIADPTTRALYLFPTKALAQDQIRSLHELTGKGLRGMQFGTYDGDTPRSERARLRREAGIILTNPDMLHLGILPNHTLWARFFTGLRFVVIDEAHAYRGVFGSHVGCVLRRLWRVCARYGSAPQIIACSATIANPGEHVRRLAGVDAVVISDRQDGSPRSAKDFCLWNPPLIDRAKTTRRSANIEAATLFARLVQSDIRTIVFSRARRVAELILLYARRILEDGASPEGTARALTDRIRAYRAGYRPEQRREIERDLRPGGRLLGVSSTSALELGIDIGDLEASLLVGFPGTMASFWQQAGRAGRHRSRHALSVLIGLDNPLDQYFMRHPSELFGHPLEHALTDPANPHILAQHLPCAAHEGPLMTEGGGDQPIPRAHTPSPRRALPGRGRTAPEPRAISPKQGRQPPRLPPGVSPADDEKLFGAGFAQAMVMLEDASDLEFRKGRWYTRPGAYPAQDVSLRALSGSRVALLDASDDLRLMEEVEGTSAHYRVHPGAIYLHQGESYLVRELDLDAGHALLEPTDADYYTQPHEINDVRIVRSLAHKQTGTTMAYLGKVQATQQVVGYRRVRQFGEEVLGVEALELPAQTFDTVALWWEVPPGIVRQVARQGLDVLGGLHAVEHAAIGMLPLFAMCDRWDIGGLSTARHPDTGEALVFMYDAFPGGVGIAEKGFELLRSLWQATYDTIDDCPCREGCPSCIQSPKCGNNNEPLDKGAAVLMLAELLKGV
jgi:DEAD/DEAH box helicase domain-containing protein